MSDVIFCRACGLKHSDNAYKCTGCGALLHEELPSQYVVTDNGTMGGLFPYKNAQALWAYYLGVFAFVPFFGILLGIVALILGVRGLRYVDVHPDAQGKAHAWVGIILGGCCAAGYSVLILLIVANR